MSNPSSTSLITALRIHNKERNDSEHTWVCPRGHTNTYQASHLRKPFIAIARCNALDRHGNHICESFAVSFQKDLSPIVGDN